MSTTFGVIVEQDDEVCSSNDGTITNLYPVARRSSGWIRFTNPLAELLPNDTKVYPIDNDCDDIKTIGDIKDEIHRLQQG
jgi:hypothetical protein